MKRLAMLGFLLLGAGGCLQPIKVITEDHLRIDEKVLGAAVFPDSPLVPPMPNLLA